MTSSIITSFTVGVRQLRVLTGLSIKTLRAGLSAGAGSTPALHQLRILAPVTMDQTFVFNYTTALVLLA